MGELTSHQTAEIIVGLREKLLKSGVVFVILTYAQRGELSVCPSVELNQIEIDHFLDAGSFSFPFVSNHSSYSFYFCSETREDVGVRENGHQCNFKPKFA